MFERFTDPARQVVIAAQTESRQLGHRHVGTEHLLLGLLHDPTSIAGLVLIDVGVTAATVRPEVARRLRPGHLDADALATLGIDLEAVRRAVEGSFGPGALNGSATGCRRQRRGRRNTISHTRFTPRSKKVLELSLREALRLHDRETGSEHILLGLLREGRGLAIEILDDLGAEPGRVQAALIRRIQRTA
jgi:ATP-dependent Clp protease ATP-binding subunit ClpA